MANETLDKSQLDIANQLIAAMDKLSERASKVASAFTSQSDIINDISNSFNDLNSKTDKSADSVEQLTNTLDSLNQTVDNTVSQGGKFTKFVKEMQDGIEATGAWHWSMNKLWENVNAPMKKLKSSMNFVKSLRRLLFMVEEQKIST